MSARFNGLDPKMYNYSEDTLYPQKIMLLLNNSYILIFYMELHSTTANT